MTGKGFAGLLAIVLAVALAAVWMQQRESTRHAAAPSALLFPALESRLADIDAVDVHGASGVAVSLRRDPAGWTVAERDGYPADVSVLSREMLKLSRVHGVEPKTANPERYAQLGVAALDAAEPPTVRVTARAGDAVVADVLIGKTGKSGHYLRAVEAEQSWLGDQRFAWPTALNGWLQKEIVDLDGADVRSVTVSRPGAESYTVARAERGQELSLQPAPEDGREVSAANLNRLAAALSRLRLRDVRRADDDAFDWTLTRYETLDGLVIEVRSHADGEHHWVRLAASGGDGEELAQKVADINARVDGWQYDISDYNAKALVFDYSTLLKPQDQ